MKELKPRYSRLGPWIERGLVSEPYARYDRVSDTHTWYANIRGVPHEIIMDVGEYLDSL